MFANIFCRRFIYCTFALLAFLNIAACGGGSSGNSKAPRVVSTSVSMSSSSPASSSASSAAIILSSSLDSSSSAQSLSRSSSSMSSSIPGLMGGAIQGTSLNLAAQVTTLAGAPPGTDGIGSVARFGRTGALVIDGSTLYIAERVSNAIRKLDTATGEVSSIQLVNGDAGALSSTLYGSVGGMAFLNGNLYITDYLHGTIRKIVASTGVATTLAGTDFNTGNADGIGEQAEFNNPKGITTDGVNLYVADKNSHTIRKIAIATGVVTTFAGTAGVSGSADGVGVAANFYDPEGIITDGVNLYIADTGNNTIRKIVIATGDVTTLAGTADTHGHVDAIGAAARFHKPAHIGTDGTNLYITDSEHYTVRKLNIASGAVTTLAGDPDISGKANGTGADTRFGTLLAIAASSNNIYVADSNQIIRKITSHDAIVSPLAGNSGADGIGALAAFNSPYGVTTDGKHLYISDSSNHTIRQVTIETGKVATIAGTDGVSGSVDGIGTFAQFYYPRGITTDGMNLYVADSLNNSIRKIVIATGSVTTLAGKPHNFGYRDDIGSAAKFNLPLGITTDGVNLFVTEWFNRTVRKIVIATGEVSTLAGSATIKGSSDGVGAAATFEANRGITTDGYNLYLVDDGAHTIRKIVIATGEVTTLAGIAGTEGNTNGIAASARFKGPTGITTDGNNLYITDSKNFTVRKIVIGSNSVTTLAGKANIYGADDGVGDAARFYFSGGITTDGVSLYVVDSGNHTIRKIH